MNPKVDVFIENAKNWQAEYKLLRQVVLATGLEEEMKWRVPCYTYQGSNVVVIHGFKAYCALNFFKGALLKDPENALVQPTETSQSARQMRFTDVRHISQMAPVIEAYIYQAIEVEKQGLKIQYKKVDEFEVPEELEQEFIQSPELKAAFEALTAGRQKAYLLHFAGAKQAATRQARIEKYRPRIMQGIGFNDCVCGLSKRMPRCDGSHKQAADLQ
jgi:uncharacterized protein YdeI (YjbR/CyaY-like superfamily)